MNNCKDFKQLLRDVVEVDETYIGGKKKGGKRGRGSENKTPVLGMVERGGQVRVIPVENVKAKTLIPLIQEHTMEGETVLVTDDLRSYRLLKTFDYPHYVIKHSQKEYVNGFIYTNTIEGFWSLLKRGIIGIYHQISKKHLIRYCNEFEFRYNTKHQSEGGRFEQLLNQFFGQRLTYKALTA